MSESATATEEMVERVLGPRPSRLGSRRKAPRNAPAKSGPSSWRREATCSLDTENHLETSVQDLAANGKESEAITCRAWAASVRTEEEAWKEKWSLKRQLASTVHAIWQGKVPFAGEAYHTFSDRLAEEQKLRPGESEQECYERVLRWRKAYKLDGPDAEAHWWFRQYEQLRNCQSEWIGYRAVCCGGSNAVPVGCKHRLCPMCCSQRAHKTKERIGAMFERLENPVLITLTLPNHSAIRKSDFTFFRSQVRQFLKQHQWASGVPLSGHTLWIKGGLYSIETTFNRRDRTWHIHCHILADAASLLPSRWERRFVGGIRMLSFAATKLSLEFDWLRITSTQWGKKSRRDADPRRQGGELESFQKWVRLGRSMRLREWRNGKMTEIDGISEVERTERGAWNRDNRRVIDLRPVTDREGAVREVLKYLTKVSNFSDLPDAVEPFMNAVRGARLIQTFGVWYGVKLDSLTAFNTERMENGKEDWSMLQCTCGRNLWECRGVFYRDDVEMDATGRWHLKGHIEGTCLGTVPRPSVRALAAAGEEEWD